MAEPMTDKDKSFLLQAAEEARKGRGQVEPNPRVGAVVVKEGKVLAAGYHARYGGPHAEIQALRRAGRGAKGATLYITLEPCSSRGKTPPCTEAIQRAGLARVVVGAVDPNPDHGGAGLALLENAGLIVQHLREEACEALIQDFKEYLDGSRPYVILKWAMTLDGRIATRTGSSMWISGEQSRENVHRLRGHVDGILVGSGTAVKDDPHLNCRLKRMPLTPARIILDPMLEIPEDTFLLRKAAARSDDDGFKLGPVMVFTQADASQEKVKRLRDLGVEVNRLEASPNARSAFLEEALVKIRAQGIHRLLVEGGSFLYSSFIEARLADQLEAYVAPKIVGGLDALSPVEGKGIASMDDAVRLIEVKSRRCGEDIWIRGFFRWPG
ncbi:MAG: bifunctional diaminohydroxyphosphoribosylaminopyrimidine deaminase/5-amino-6-(5-phosphoribosylamino)uracil reductase RibD [Planctomycetota bacterium]|jgi:diaminohydroxyphosphoribosylaminopyrimidine deaminase/5-amino-6-(5-phosphoribosylamino)uracil reductase